LSAWVTEDEVVPFFHEKESEVQKAPQDAIKHEQCKEHRLYAERKDTLVSMYRERSVEPSGMKYEIVERFPSALTEEKPREPQLFDSTKKLPKSPKDTGRLPISYLQSIVKYHGLVPCRIKDELALCFCHISNNRKYLCFNRQKEDIPGTDFSYEGCNSRREKAINTFTRQQSYLQAQDLLHSDSTFIILRPPQIPCISSN